MYSISIALVGINFPFVRILNLFTALILILQLAPASHLYLSGFLLRAHLWWHLAPFSVFFFSALFLTRYVEGLEIYLSVAFLCCAGSLYPMISLLDLIEGLTSSKFPICWFLCTVVKGLQLQCFYSLFLLGLFLLGRLTGVYSCWWLFEIHSLNPHSIWSLSCG